MADSKISELSVASALSGAESFYAIDGANDVKVSPIQLARYTVESYSYDTTNSNENTISGAINQLSAVGTNIRNLLLSVHRVGSLYWSSNSTSPAELFGGTWTQITDKFILAAGDTYSNGASGGSETVTLTISEIPSHSHGGASGKPSTNTSGGSSATNTDSSTATHVHSIVSLSGKTNDKGTHNHAWSYGGSNTTSGGGGSLSTGTAGAGKLTSSSNGKHTHTFTTTKSTTGENNYKHTHSLNAHTHNLKKHTHTISSQGGGGAHNNMPPYIAKYCWERIS